MNKKAIIAIVLVMALPLAMVMFLLFHQPQKPVSHRQGHGVVDNAPRPTEFAGVGLMLRAGSGAQAVIVQQTVPNSPAAEARIASGMIVSRVNDVSLEGKRLADCVNLIRGPVGTTVRLELITPDGSRTNTVELTRRKLKL